MSTIVFVMQPATGHLNPTFKLARGLRLLGHRVYYLTIPRYRDVLKSQGFESIALPYSVSSGSATPQPGLKESSKYQNIQQRSWKLISDNQEEIDELLLKVRPDLAVVDSNLPAMALTTGRLNISTVLLNVMLPLDDPYEALAPIVEKTVLIPLLTIPELILCPEEFDFPRENGLSNRPRYYIEPSIDLDRVEPRYQWNGIDQGKPLIYCSLGTHNGEYGETKQLFQTVISAVARRPDWQLILSMGTDFQSEDFSDTTPNVFLGRSFPQLQILKNASCMITHGGLGSVKECIFLGVPMIVFPCTWDQPHNAARVAYHGLGVMGNINKVSVQQIDSLIDKVIKGASFKKRVEAMRQRFQELEESKAGIAIIQRILLENQRQMIISFSPEDK